MYSERIITANLEAFAAESGWMPVYHSFEQVQEFTKYIDSLIKMETNSRSSYVSLVKTISQKRMQEVRRWIENEQVLCGLDSSYFESRYAYVCDEKGQIFKFQNRMSQNIFDSVIADFDEKQVSIELLILKARQLGITTKSAMKFIHRMLFVPHTQAVMASVQSDKSELIGRILDTAYNRCPWWLVPRRLPKGAFDNGSILSIQSGMQATGIAQGWTPTMIHICLKPNTLIHLQDGLVRQIKNVVPGDKVITSKGRLVPVRAAVKSLRMNEVACEISLWGNYDPLVVTRDHPIFTPNGFQAAETINKHDYVGMPVRSISKTVKSIDLTHYGIGIKKATGIVKKETIKLTREWGWLCGLYLAEGSAHQNTRIGNNHWDGVYFCIHQKEIDEFLSSIKSAVGLFQHVRISRNKKSQSATLTVHNAGLTRWFVENFGHLAEGKRIPEWVFSAGKDFVLGLLRGYLEGDGHIPTNLPGIRADSISMPLLIQIRDLIAACGFGWSCLYHNPAGNKYGRECKDRWALTINGDNARALRAQMNWPQVEKKNSVLRDDDPRRSSAPKHWKYSEDGKYIWIEVFENRAVECAEFYDLEVDAPEHDFCTIHCCVKNSEIADLPKPKKVIEEGLLRATHSSKNLFMIFEGTGGGNTGWLADTWRTAKEDFPMGRSRLCPVFIPWAMCPDIYPEKDWLRKFPIPSNWKPCEVTRKHVLRCELYIRNTAYLAKIAGRNWRMPLEQQWFWEFNYLQACKNHSQKIWLSQMPADDFEALTGVHDTVFDVETIQEIEDHIYEVRGQTKERKRPAQAYAITGDSIDEGFEPDDSIIDWDKAHIRVDWESNRGQRFNWILVPLKDVDEENEMDTFDKLLVFEEPKAGYDYSCGIDTADGLGKEDEDRTCLSVTRNRFGDEFDYQTAEFVSNRINSAQIVGFAACVAAWYGKQTRNPLGVKFCVEQIGRPGDTCQHQLKLMGFHYHHKPRRYDSKKLRDDSGKKEGWFSNVWSVPILMTRFTEAVNGGWYRPASRWLIEELKTLERHAAAGRISKMEHRAGQHDDRVRAAAQSFFTAHDFDILAERAQKRYALPAEKNPPLSKATCSWNKVDLGDW